MPGNPDSVAAGRAHLERIEKAGDPHLTLRDDVSAVIERLDGYTSTAEGAADLDARYVLGWLRWHRHVATPGTVEGAVDQIAALWELSPCFVAGMEPLPGELLAYLAAAAFGPAEEMSPKAAASGDREQVSAAISLWQRMIAPQGTVHPEDLPDYWSNLGVMLAARYGIDCSQADLDAAISAFETALDLAPGDSPDRARYLANLSGALYQRAAITGSERDRAAAVAAGQLAAAAIGPGDENGMRYLSNLGNGLLASYEQTGEEADLTAAIAAFTQALGACAADDPDRAAILSNQGNALLRRSELTGTASAADLDASVRAHRAAVDATAKGDPDLVKRLSNMSTALRASFARRHRDADLDAAIEAARAALALLSPGSPDRPGTLFSLGAALQARFMRGGALEDLDAGIGFLRQAVGEMPPSHADRAMLIGNLGGFLMMRYEWTGAVADLDSAIAMAREAVNAAPVGYVHRPALLSFLGSALSDRAELPGESAESLLDEAVAVGRESVAATPPDFHERARHLDALAVSLHERGELTGSPADLDEAIDLAGQAAAASQGDGADVDRAGWLSNLSIFLRDRAARTGAVADLDQALVATYRALEAVPPGHHIRAMLLMNAGQCLRDDFRRRGARKALVLARQMYLMAAGTQAATPTVRIHAMRQAAELTALPLTLAYLSQRRRISRAAALLESAVLLLPEVAPRHLARADQQRQVGGFAGLAADAAAHALADAGRRESRAHRAARAIALLEHGRGILLSQVLATRSDLTAVRDARPDLADRYQRLRDLLDTPVAAGRLPDGAFEGSAAGPDRSQLARDFAATVAEIRAVDTFAGFMLPPPLPELASAAGSGAVVFNVSDLRSDAILLKSTGDIDYVRLPMLTPDALAEQAGLFRAALQARLGAPADRDAQPGLDPEQVLLDILEWLWDAAAGPALDALGFDGRPNPWGLYEVKWIPSGLLGQLPIHAAGRHRAAVGGAASADGRQPPTVMDRVISSYGPTVRALHHAFSQAEAARRQRPTRSLVVAMPATPGAGPLPGVAESAGRLRATLPGATLLMPSPYPDGIDPGTVSGEPTRAEVLDLLDGCEIAHFACHGVTDPVDPSRSKLLLADHRTDPLTVAGLAPVRLDAARLAYLSACSTARNEVAQLADESIHLASAFQLAGFPHVIGTLWEVDADVAAVVADEFYRRLAADRGFPDVNQAATVLHEITRELRDSEPDSPFTWAGYLHVGT